MDKPNYYAIITADVRYDKNINANAKLLYAEITALTNMNGSCFASNNYFSELYGVDTSTIQRWLKSLEDEGYILRKVEYVEGTKQIKNRYVQLCGHPHRKNEVTPHRKNAQDNNTPNGDCNNNLTDSNTKKDLPSFIDSDLWKDFLDVRKRAKAINSERAITTLLNKIEKYHKDGFDCNKAIEESILKGWKDIYPKHQTNDFNYSPRDTHGFYGGIVQAFTSIPKRMLTSVHEDLTKAIIDYVGDMQHASSIMEAFHKKHLQDGTVCNRFEWETKIIKFVKENKNEK